MYVQAFPAVQLLISSFLRITVHKYVTQWSLYGCIQRPYSSVLRSRMTFIHCHADPMHMALPCAKTLMIHSFTEVIEC